MEVEITVVPVIVINAISEVAQNANNMLLVFGTTLLNIMGVFVIKTTINKEMIVYACLRLAQLNIISILRIILVKNAQQAVTAQVLVVTLVILKLKEQSVFC